MKLDKCKCDRCGVEYTLIENYKQKQKIFFNYNPSYKEGVVMFENGKGIELDFCPSCIKSFEHWIAKSQEKN